MQKQLLITMINPDTHMDIISLHGTLFLKMESLSKQTESLLMLTKLTFLRSHPIMEGYN